MKYIIYAAVAALILWAVVCLVRHVRRQLINRFIHCLPKTLNYNPSDFLPD